MWSYKSISNGFLKGFCAFALSKLVHVLIKIHCHKIISFSKIKAQQEPRINTLIQRHVAVNLPVVITFIPVVKVHQESTIHHVGNRGNTDERGILLIDGLQLHTNPKP